MGTGLRSGAVRLGQNVLEGGGGQVEGNKMGSIASEVG